MGNLIERNESGEWNLRGVPWKCLGEGSVITKEVRERLYGALCKLLDYEKTGLSPEEVRNAAEKQKSKRVIKKVQDTDLNIGTLTFKAGTKTYWCPICKRPITGADHYCRWCGQKIDWEEK